MSKSTLVAGFGASQHVTMSNLGGINHEDSVSPPAEGGNCINWVAGHILASRNSILKLLGGRGFLSEEECAPYQRGSKQLQPGDDCVPMDRLLDGLQQTGNEIIQRLQGISEEELDKEFEVPNFPVKFDEPTVAAHIFLLFYHEGYHTGQLGLGRRVLGKEAAIK